MLCEVASVLCTLARKRQLAPGAGSLWMARTSHCRFVLVPAAARWVTEWLRSVGLEDATVRLAAYGQLLQELAAPNTFVGLQRVLACSTLLTGAARRP